MQQEILLNLIKSISIKDRKANLLCSLELINTLHDIMFQTDQFISSEVLSLQTKQTNDKNKLYTSKFC